MGREFRCGNCRDPGSRTHSVHRSHPQLLKGAQENASTTDTLDSLWQVVAVGLLFGAGLPAIFAFGLKSLSLPNPDGTEGPTTLGKMGAYLCFAIVLVTIFAGILLLMKNFLASTFGIHVF